MGDPKCVAEVVVSNTYARRLEAIVEDWMENPAQGRAELKKQLEVAKEKRPVAIEVLEEVLA